MASAEQIKDFTAFAMTVSPSFFDIPCSTFDILLCFWPRNKGLDSDLGKFASPPPSPSPPPGGAKFMD